MCHFWTKNGPFVMNKIFLVQTIIITFVYLLALFIEQNLKKILTANPELWGCVIFGPQIFHLTQTNFFFWKKLLTSFSSTYWSLSFYKILNKFLEPIQSYEDVPLSDPKYSNLSRKIFFGTNHYYYFHLPIGPFHWAKFKKKSYFGSRVMRMRQFWAQNSPFAPNKFFFGKLSISLSSTY